MKPKTITRRSREPIRVSQAGMVLRRFAGRERGLLERSEGLGRRGFGAAL
ncbi:MAG: hypothetical protein ACRDTR_22475 [Rubrobacter sp.]